MMLLGLISWPYVRRHLVRSLLTTLGIVLGVAVFVGMHSANEAVLYAFHRTVDRIAGATHLQVSAGEAGFDEEVLERVQSLPEVRVAVPVIEAAVDTGLKGQGSLLVLAVDLTGDRSLRDYDLESGDEELIDDPLVFLAQPDSLMVTPEFAERNGLDINSRMPMWTMEGEKQFTIRAVMRSGGLASAFGGNLAIMDVYAAQKVFGRGRKFDRIDVAVTEGVTVERARVAIQRLLGPGFQVGPPSSRGQEFESLVSVYSITANISSAFALFIGMFIIYNSFAIAVTQRRSEIGILRALGATRGQVRTLFLVESGIAGFVGSLVGAMGGILLARGVAGFIAGLLQGVYGIAQRADEVATEPRLIAFAIGMGMATSVLAAWLPARNAARVDPVQALQKGKYQVLSAGENRIRRRAAALLGAGSVLCLLFGRSGWAFYGGYALTVVASLLLAPSLALWLAEALRPALKWIRPVEGALAADSLIQAPRRTSGTVAALMLSLAQVIGLAGIARGSYGSIVDWLATALNPDLFITTSQNLATRTFHFPESMGPELRKIPGIADVQMVRSARVTFRGGPVMVVSVEIAGIAKRARRRPVEGNERDMYRLAAAGEGVIVSDNLAELHQLHVGDVLEIAAPTGLLRLPVVGVVLDWSDQLGTVLMDRSVFTRHWRDDLVDIFRVYLAPGASAPDVKSRILERFAGSRRLFVLTNRDVRDYILRLTNQWLGLTYVQIAVAVLVALLGIVNTLTVSIIDRRRELGVLQAVGALRHQVRHTIWMEAIAVGTVGLVLGLALGSVNLYYVLQVAARDLSGMRVAYGFPVTLALWLVPIMLGASFVSALVRTRRVGGAWLARRGARIRVG
ncbi:MAG: FtsX-like permease family protein [Acidobacteria bacterium]|nr:FtsX-like permease family protein [Acidobacteriota bacterium]